VVADNLSSDATVTLHVEGQLVDPGATCAGERHLSLRWLGRQ
jgi:hypothetical protein